MIDIRPVGDTAVLVDLERNAAVHRFAAAARERWRDELTDVVPGHTTVLLVFSQAVPYSEALVSELRALSVTVRPRGSGAEDLDAVISGTEDSDAMISGIEHARAASTEALTIPVRYDGADLGAVAQRLGMGCDEVVATHTAGEYTVAFMGFAPGFPYLIESSEAGSTDALSAATRAVSEAPGALSAPTRALLAVPRLATPRTTVPAGSVAVAAGYCGIYPRSSPGGWNLLGHTGVVLFDAASQPPALLTPGARVRFSAV